jgi:hypothetical protein
MKFFITLTTAALSFATGIQAAPAANTLPEGWVPMSEDIIEARRAGDHMYKRTPGGVC